MPDSQSVSRRGFVKWAGALAAAGVVGVGLGFGGDLLLRPSTTKTVTSTAPGATVTAPGTTITLPATTLAAPGTTVTTTVTPHPPTFSQQQMDSIVQQLIAKHAGNAVDYSATPMVHSLCAPVKVYSKNGVVQSVVPGDDTIFPNVAREDSVMTKEDLMKGRIQARGKANVYAFPHFMQGPLRILYPMKRVSARGEYPGQFLRITWQEALDTIANEYMQQKEKYGLYFHQTGFPLIPGAGWFLDGYFPPGAGIWGNVSLPAQHFASGAYYPACGVYGSEITGGYIEDIFNSKLIVNWGNDPAVSGGYAGLVGGIGYYYRLAHESGIPAISIDCINSITANNLCDQWIPIRAGTDLAMMLAVANVLFKENLYDTDYVSKFVEPTGFQKWKDYVLGNTAGPDGAKDRTPEWAQTICGVPAATIKSFAEVYASSKPVWMVFGWGPGREHEGEVACRAAIYLQAMTGNIGIAGGNDQVSYYSFRCSYLLGG